MTEKFKENGPWRNNDFPPPHDRRTYSVHHTAEEALKAGRNLVYLLNGIPIGYRLGVFKRFGAYILVSYPK